MATKTETQSAKPPIAKRRLGLIFAAIWERTGDGDPFYTATFERRYRDKDGKWQSTHSYSADDLLLLSKLADQVHTEIMERRAGEFTE